MKETWIGVIGAIVGSIITIVGTPYFNEWQYGPKEGLVHVDVNSIGSNNVNEHLRDQVSNYPIFITISHKEGPSAKGITVKLKSKHNLGNVQVEREDDHSRTHLSKDNKTLKIDIPELRKNSINKYQVTSGGDPNYKKSVQISQGQLYENIVKLKQKDQWYKSDIFIFIVAVIISAFGFVILFYLLFRLYGKDLRYCYKDKDFYLILALALLLSLLPIFSAISFAIPLILIAALNKRVSKLEENGSIEE